MKKKKIIAIIGYGNIGSAIANGLIAKGIVKKKELTVTRRKKDLIEQLKEDGFNATDNNAEAVKSNNIIILAITPQKLDKVFEQIKESVTEDHIIISVVSGATINQIKNKLDGKGKIVRVMPNTAISIGESMTCISADSNGYHVDVTKEIFDAVGETIIINEDLMGAATALCACGTAFFLRAIRAASQGGIEIGFHAEEALHMAAQTAKGAAAMLLSEGKHPEREIDKVTTPQGITISGLNQMEHNGFSSSMIKGIVMAAEKANVIYKKED